MKFEILRNVWSELPICIKILNKEWIPTGELRQLEGWCYQTFGNPDANHNWKYIISSGTIYLLRDEDLTLFMLKWKT